MPKKTPESYTAKYAPKQVATHHVKVGALTYNAYLDGDVAKDINFNEVVAVRRRGAWNKQVTPITLKPGRFDHIKPVW